MELMQKLFWAIINGFKKLIENFIHFIQELLRKIRNWFARYQMLIVFVISLAISIGLLIWLRNPFLSVLIILILMYKYSPERESDTTAQNFKKKVGYRGAIYGCLIGTALIYLPFFGWIIALAILVFLSYLIWVVRNSEELYQLPIQWRFWSATLTIIDAIVLVVLFIVRF